MPLRRAFNPRLLCLLLFSASLAHLASAGVDEAAPIQVSIDCAKIVGAIRPLHGLNNGPLDVGGTVDLSEGYRTLSPPLVRLHDSHWPNADVVDLHAVFPRLDADPADGASYDFIRTDAYLAAIRACGAKVMYRLGESIEHGVDKRRLRPPPDPQKWAAICAGVVRHYNKGWAGGLKDQVAYWEIWNEPDNRPNMWTGTDDDFFALYAAAARRLKGDFPDIKVGGPGVGNAGSFGGDGIWIPSPFTARFLDFCRRESVPLDFFSWHLYSVDPSAFARQAEAIRAMLDARGFAGTESHLNEWNYLPDNDWAPASPAGQGEARERFYDRIGGTEGAAFTASALIDLLDARIDAAAYYAGDTNPFGLFTRHGVPRPNFFAMEAFSQLHAESPQRLAVTLPAGDGVKAAAGASPNSQSFRVLLANFRQRRKAVRLLFNNIPKDQRFRIETRSLAEDRRAGWRWIAASSSAGALQVDVDLAGPGVCLVRVVDER